MGLLSGIRWLKIALLVIPILLLVVFVAIWISKRSSPTSNETNALQAYRPIICENAYSTEAHYEKDNRPYIDIKLTPGCFSGFVAVPDKWKTWQGQLLGDNPTDWVAEWYAGWNRPGGPWSAGQINGGKVDLVRTTRKLRAQGQGTLRLYRITGDEGQTKADKDESGSMPPSKEVIRHAISPESGLGDGYTFVIEECHRAGGAISCSGKAMNTTDAAHPLSSYSPNLAVDDEGYSTQVNQIGFTTGGAVENLMPNVPVKFMVIVHDPHLSATKLNLTLHISYLNRNDPLIFKDIPIQ